MPIPRRWLVSPAFDLAWFAGPAALSALAALALPAGDTPPWAWLLLVVLVDVAHVYAALYRTYLDPEELARRPGLLAGVPAACWLLGVLLYRAGPLWFWRALAYVAAFHFVRQQYGFLRLYQRLHDEQDPLDARLDAWALYGSMLYPLAYWHCEPRAFAWFVQGDFLRLPRPAAWLAAAAYGLVLTAFVLRQAWLLRAGRPPNWGKLALIGSTAAAWSVGIVVLDSDIAFTVTNVTAHGLPYFALVWLWGRRKGPSEPAWQRRWSGLPVLASAALFFLPLGALACLEEGLWDWTVWHEHAGFFGGLPPLDLPDALLNLLVPLLAVPQATHYVLDYWIWRMDGSNPGLKEALLAETCRKD